MTEKETIIALLISQAQSALISKLKSEIKLVKFYNNLTPAEIFELRQDKIIDDALNELLIK